MGNLLEKERDSAEEFTREGIAHGAAHAWDAMRALVRLTFGPDDPRVWASLSRSARSLANFAVDPNERLRSIPEFHLNAAASLAASAAAGFDAVSQASAGGDGSSGVPVPPSERSFAEETLAWIRSKAHAAGLVIGPWPASSLAEAIYSENNPRMALLAQKPEAFTFPSALELRAALAKAGDPGSQEALSLRSRLGMELWDTGGKDAALESTELLREASAGLDALLGPKSPESVAAKERLARRLSGMNGYGSLAPFPFLKYLSKRNSAEGRALFKELKNLAPRGAKGDELRRRAATGEITARIVTDIGKAYGDARKLMEDSMDTFFFPGGIQKNRPLTESHDLVMLGLHSGNGEMASSINGLVLAGRRNFLGGRQPETAYSLALAGDLLGDTYTSCAFWALAMEALEGRGERYCCQEAELKLRIARTLFFENDFSQAARLFKEAEGIFLAERGEASPERVECAAFFAGTQFRSRSGDHCESGEIFSSLLKLIDGVPPWDYPVLEIKEAQVLALVLAGAAADMSAHGETERGAPLMARASELRARYTGPFQAGRLADFYLGRHAMFRAKAMPNDFPGVDILPGNVAKDDDTFILSTFLIPDP
jgi:hypothetical protein